MRIYGAVAVAAVTLVASTSCATAPPQLLEVPEKRYAVPAGKIVIANYIPERTQAARIWVGFYPLPNDSTIPPFTDLVLRDLTAHLVTNGDHSAGTLEIDLIAADLMMELLAADNIPFIGIASAFSGRRHMCRVDANFRYGDKVVRRVFETVERKNRGWGDLPTPEKAALVRTCIDKIVRDVAKFSSQLISN